eukprot:598993-Lingulodinium_polyedra.AAC.1
MLRPATAGQRATRERTARASKSTGIDCKSCNTFRDTPSNNEQRTCALRTARYLATRARQR